MSQQAVVLDIYDMIADCSANLLISSLRCFVYVTMFVRLSRALEYM